jgi:hypothetical protein
MDKEATVLRIDEITKDQALEAIAYTFSLVFERIYNLPTKARHDIINILQVLESEIEQSEGSKVFVITRIRHYVGREDI